MISKLLSKRLVCVLALLGYGSTGTFAQVPEKPEPAGVVESSAEHTALQPERSEVKSTGQAVGAVSSAQSDAKEKKSSPTLTAEPSAEEITQSLLRLAKIATERKDYDAAEAVYLRMLTSKVTPAQKREAMIGIGRMYYRKGDLAKAAAAFEKYLKEYPSDADSPAVYLDLGRTLREMGSYKLALARFYNVINSTLSVNQAGFETYRQLAKTAQYEIAETYFLAGEYSEASKYYSRVSLVDLTPQDRGRVSYKSIYALYLAGKYDETVKGVKKFLEEMPDDDNGPEARYLLAMTLRQLKRYNEAYSVTLELLKAVGIKGDPSKLAYWQRKTGNQLANEFYDQGDFSSALAIYKLLASLGDDPAWKMPALYQIGLCQERLRQTATARTTYQTIIDQLTPAKGLAPIPENLADVARMAVWRRDHLDWEDKNEMLLDRFLKNSANEVTIGGHLNYDPNGGPAKTQTALR
ncbi:MAG TPA: tetratricopeptide repeat protein [Opitutaceae bacterium]|nr:tetratricopeptide repeat protein [Opitutaceae bacterium]